MRWGESVLIWWVSLNLLLRPSQSRDWTRQMEGLRIRKFVLKTWAWNQFFFSSANTLEFVTVQLAIYWAIQQHIASVNWFQIFARNKVVRMSLAKVSRLHPRWISPWQGPQLLLTGSLLLQSQPRRLWPGEASGQPRWVWGEAPGESLPREQPGRGPDQHRVFSSRHWWGGEYFAPGFIMILILKASIDHFRSRSRLSRVPLPPATRRGQSWASAWTKWTWTGSPSSSSPLAFMSPTWASVSSARPKRNSKSLPPK